MILLSVGAVIVLDARDGRPVRTNVLAAAGVTFPLMLELVRRTVREWSRADLLVVLSRRLEPGQLQPIIDRLLDG